MAAAAWAGATSWTRRMWAPARMAAVLVTVVGSGVEEADPSAPLRDDNKVAVRVRVRKLLRETPARMGNPRVWSWSRWARSG